MEPHAHWLSKTDETTGQEYFTLATGDVHFIGQYEDSFKLLFRGEPFEFNVNGINVSWAWKDQGWGNRKGQLEFKLIRDGTAITSVAPGIAEHHWTNESVQFERGHAFFDSLVVGDVFEIWFIVGGGGGHELFLKDFRIEFRRDDFMLK